MCAAGLAPLIDGMTYDVYVCDCHSFVWFLYRVNVSSVRIGSVRNAWNVLVIVSTCVCVRAFVCVRYEAAAFYSSIYCCIVKIRTVCTFLSLKRLCFNRKLMFDCIFHFFAFVVCIAAAAAVVVKLLYFSLPLPLPLIHALSLSLLFCRFAFHASITFDISFGRVGSPNTGFVVDYRIPCCLSIHTYMYAWTFIYLELTVSSIHKIH